ncbi:YcjF family protein [Helicobacter salomonis]|uniref:YcjF family protein n=1 Tax=Helicobacter salomonis TaxID=56878 RepID=UPI000CF1913A|nr:DUF697 domain-containing protein [Helicobacter salomonis]
MVRDKFQLGQTHLQRVRALEIEDDDGEIKKCMGIKDLIAKTYSLLDEGRRAAFARKQQFDRKLCREQYKKDAHKAITGYTTAATGIGATPIPFSDFALLAPTQLAMILHISKIYGLTVTKEGAQTILTASLGALGVGLAVRAAVGGILKFIPGVGSVVGGTINATVAGGTTNLMGKAYVAYLDDNIDNLEGAIRVFNADVFRKYLDGCK